MSYRDLRNFSEAMRVLGFPKPISLESFRTLNWELMEECLRWLAARVEPDTELPAGCDTMEQRVALVTTAIALFHSRANLKLNGKRLYGADGWAVREMMKVATLLRSALETPSTDDNHQDHPISYDFSNKLSEIKQARALATDIVAQSTFLYDLLAKEPENKHSNRLTKEGYLIIRSDLTRSQQLNLADCMQKLRAMIRQAAVVKKAPSPDTEERIRQRHLKAARLRVAVKRDESLKRAMRKPPSIDL